MGISMHLLLQDSMPRVAEGGVLSRRVSVAGSFCVAHM